MTTVEARTPSRRQNVGWWILLLVGVLMAGNGVMWFFVGPARSGPYLARVTEMPEEEFRQLYPGVVEGLSRNRRQVGIWYAAFGAMALVTALGGLRHGNRWAWYATWAVPTALIPIGLVYMPRGELVSEGTVLIGVGVIALLGKSRPQVSNQTPYGRYERSSLRWI